MHTILLQVQLLLAAVSAVLPLIPAQHRNRAAELLDLAARALAAGSVVAANADDLARKLADVRAEVEAIAASGRSVTAEELEAAMARVRAASATFRAALGDVK